MSEAAVLVCGFFDEATAVAGLAWGDARGTGGVLAAEGEVGEASTEISDADAPRVTLSAGEVRCEAELSPLVGELSLADAAGDPPVGRPSATICRVRLALTTGGRGRSLECAGHSARWADDPLEGAELWRHLAMPGPDGTLLVLVARREPGAEGHDAERCSAWLLEREGQARAFAETLLSTQYDEAGRQTRVGLELWPGETGAPPMRAAGTTLGAAAELDGHTAALLETSAEGIEGRGSYLIWRP